MIKLLKRNMSINENTFTEKFKEKNTSFFAAFDASEKIYYVESANNQVYFDLVSVYDGTRFLAIPVPTFCQAIGYNKNYTNIIDMYKMRIISINEYNKLVKSYREDNDTTKLLKSIFNGAAISIGDKKYLEINELGEFIYGYKKITFDRAIEIIKKYIELQIKDLESKRKEIEYINRMMQFIYA